MLFFTPETNKIMKKCAVGFLLIALLVSAGHAQVRITVDASQPGEAISPTMYGIFFEDINFGADGGLYAELVKNRSFEFDLPMRGWRILKRGGAEGRTYAVRNKIRPRNPRYLRIEIDEQGGGFGLNNEGFRGMGVRQGVPYNFSMEIRRVKGNVSGLQAELVGSDQTALAECRITGLTEKWQTLKCRLVPSKTDAKATLNILFRGEGTVDIDMVSLFPADTWKKRENGLRADLVQLLADMKPGFLRFPGGCIVEGFDLSQRYQWKNTVGDLINRVVTINRWNFEFKHRPAPDYFQSFGLGFYEYFLLAEDLGAEPMPIINCGMACQFNTGELVPLEELDPYIQDALDLIEFANGPLGSRWGRLRADMGHPQPFNMKMLGIGNEQWGPQYIERYIPFAKAIRDRYPEIQLIAATGSDGTIFPNGEAEIEYLWEQWRRLKPEFVDEHFYRNPEWFLENTDWYDNYDRSGPKLFVGEYAAQSVGVGIPDNRNTLKCALYEAAFMTGMERNADLVHMTCYAPLFGHEEAWQWRPDLIWFDNLNSYGSVNYQVQKLFSLNPGTHMLASRVSGVPRINDKSRAINVSTTWDENAREVIIKAVNVSEQPLTAMIDFGGTPVRLGNTMKAIVLSSEKLTDENTLEEPDKIVPQETIAKISGTGFDVEFKPYSFTLLRIPVK
jgi:alpha-N-arabinofuranosidase